jgi:hypothetical protein
VKNLDRPSGVVNATLTHDGFECPNPLDYAALNLGYYEGNPLSINRIRYKTSIQHDSEP